jgi:formate hydrogenlyase subunit 6/NADH:ubiquinone oxidoreductase subunit I
MAFKITDKCIGCSVCKKICPADAILGERGKLHKIDGGLCLDCFACGYICPQSAVNDAEGHTIQRIRFRKNWPKPLIDKDLCMSCGICLDSCPAACLELTFTEDAVDKKGWPLLANPRMCIACRFCMIDCPVDAIQMTVPNND